MDRDEITEILDEQLFGNWTQDGYDFHLATVGPHQIKIEVDSGSATVIEKIRGREVSEARFAGERAAKRAALYANTIAA